MEQKTKMNVIVSDGLNLDADRLAYWLPMLTTKERASLRVNYDEAAKEIMDGDDYE